MGTVRDKKGKEQAHNDPTPLPSCLLCHNRELYRRKDFAPWIGIAIVAMAAIVTLWTENYLFLVLAGLIDLLLFLVLKEVIVCYQCGAEHRGVHFEKKPDIFDIAIADRHRFGDAYKGPRSTND